MEMAPPQIGRSLVVVVDDRVSHGEREDTIGPLVRELLERIERGERDELRGEKLAELRVLMDSG